MVYSMTGVGTGRATSDRGSVEVEVQTVNSRFLDIHCRLPRSWEGADERVKSAVRERLNRGRAVVTARWVPEQESAPAEADPDAVRATVRLLKAVAEDLGN